MRRLITSVIIFFSASTFFSEASVAQSGKFVAPSWTDTLVNPVKNNREAALGGKHLYLTDCAPCHGNEGKGNGIAAAGLSVPPVDHTSAAVQRQSDGALFWMITNGHLPMPSFKLILTTQQRWELVSFIRTLKKH